MGETGYSQDYNLKGFEDECMSFVLDDQLKKDTHFMYELDLSILLLMNDRGFPWFILVPKRPRVEEIMKLNDEDAALLMEEIREVSRFLDHFTKPHKINVASLGNVVRQLHVHVVARKENDRAFPKPVWSVPAEEDMSYTEEEVEAWRELTLDWFAP